MSKPNKHSIHEQQTSPKKAAIIIGVLAVIILGVFLLSSIKGAPQQSNIQMATIKVEETSVDVLKALLDVYYVKHGYYPVTINRLRDDISAKESEYGVGTLESYESTTKALKQLDYSVRGDNKAFKLTYLSSDGQERSISGEYDKEFN